jgi:alcohol dehydrogenase
MKAFDTYFPTKLIFGEGTIARLGEAARQYGSRAMVVTTGDDMKKFGILDQATASLDKAGVSYLVFSDVEQNPKDYNVDEGVRRYREAGCQMTIGLGGGSAMDAAKAVAMIARNGGVVMDYMPGHPRAAEQLTQTDPCLCVTTTAGTGSEATYFAVVTNTTTHEKPGLGCPCMMPVTSIIDPSLMMSLPRGVTAQTGVDVFFHAMEAYLSTVATPYTDMVALEAMRIVAQYLPQVLEHPDNREARCQMAWANTLGGIAIVFAATCGLHAMGHSISGVTDIPHGRSLSIAAVAFLNYTWQADPARYATVARILGADPAVSDEEAASQCGSLMEQFLKNAGMQTRISELGVRPDQIDLIADVACSSMSFCMGVTLRHLERQDIVNMLQMSL